MKKQDGFLRRLTALALALCMLAALTAEIFAANIIASGYCGGEGDGTNLSWKLTSDGTLTISGSGAMADYLWDAAPPWDTCRKQLRKLRLSANITTIGSRAFLNCSGFTGTLTLPEKLQSIGDDAFRNCSGFTRTLTLPEKLQSIGNGAFAHCSGFTGDLTIPGGVACISGGSFEECAGLDGHLLISDGVKSIEGSGFNGCSFHSAYIAGSVSKIKSSAFSGCNKLSQLFLEEGLQEIGESAFSNTALEKITLPKSVSAVESGFASEASALRSIEVADGNLHYQTDYTHAALYDNSGTLVQYAIGRPDSSFRIPESVKYVDQNAFWGATRLRNVRLPDGLKGIRDLAFADCTELTSVNLPDKLEEIGRSAFGGCSSLQKIEIPGSVKTVSDDAFQGCTSLRSAILKEGVEVIGNGAFYGCTGLEEISLPSTLHTIAPDGRPVSGEAFYKCGLKSVRIPSGVKRLDTYGNFAECKQLREVFFDEGLEELGCGTFTGCENLETVVLPDSLKKIENGSFRGCSSIQSLLIPRNVTAIDQSIFDDCTALESVYFYCDAPTINKYSFDSTPHIPNFYFLDGTAGWTVPTYEGYPTAVFMPDYERNSVIRMDFGDINVNHSGMGYAYFLIIDELQRPSVGKTIFYSITNSAGKVINGQAVTDAYGIMQVRLYAKNTESFTIKFYRPSGEQYTVGGEQTVTVNVLPLTFTQSWEGQLGAAGTGKLSDGVEGKIGAIDLEATFAFLEVSSGGKGRIKITEDHHDGKRDFTIETTVSPSYGIAVGAGAAAKLSRYLEISPASVKGGAKTNYGYTSGLTIEDIGDFTYEKKLKLSHFISDLLVYLTWQDANMSIMRHLMNDQLGLFSHYSFREAETKIVLDSGVKIAQVKMRDETESVVSGDMLGIGRKSIWGASLKDDEIKNTLTYTKSYSSEDELAFAKMGFSKELTEGTGLDTTKTGTVIDITNGSLWGFKNSSSASLTAVKDKQTDEIQELSYKTMRGRASDLMWLKQSSDRYQTVTYSGEAAREIAKKNSDTIGKMASGNPFSVSIPDAAWMMNSMDYIGQCAEILKIKQGVDFDFPIGFTAGVGLNLDFSLSGEKAYSYETQKSVLYRNNNYITATMVSLEDEIEKSASTLSDILSSALDMTKTLFKDLFQSIKGVLNGEIKLFNAKIKSNTTNSQQTYAAISTVKEDESSGGKAALQSFAISVVQRLDTQEAAAQNNTPISASKSYTVGLPYQVAVFQDEACTQLLSDEAFAKQTLSLTIGYDEAMLDAAGATADTALAIFRFDKTVGSYVKEESSQQDFAKKTVTASIAHNGEYILATDGQAPDISEFSVSDQSATPAFSATIKDFSGISMIELYIDHIAVVTGTSFAQFYDPMSGAFCYSVSKPLSAGTHTATLKAKDKQENICVTELTFETADLSDGQLTIDIPKDMIRSDYFRIDVACTYENIDRMLLKLEPCGDSAQQAKALYFQMSKDENSWTATVFGLYGEGEYLVSAIAYDENGNKTECQAETLRINIPEPEKGMQVTVQKLVQNENGTQVQIGLRNYASSQRTAILAVAAYDDAGKMLGIVFHGTAINGNGTSTQIVDIPNAYADTHEVQAFILEPGDELRPLNASSRFIKE